MSQPPRSDSPKPAAAASGSNAPASSSEHAAAASCSPSSAPAGSGRAAWRKNAGIAGVFSFIMLLLLLANHFRLKSADPIEPAELLSVKQELEKSPLDEDLKARIRELDLQLRRSYFRGRRAGEIGAYLLLAGLVILVASVKRSRPAAVELPDRPESLEVPDDRGHAEAWGRRGVAAAGGLMAIAAVVLSASFSGSGIDFAAVASSAEGASAAQEHPFPSAEEVARQWPRFRGPGGSGVSPHALPVESWDGETGENILWKRELPSRGASSPLLWDDRIFLTGASADEEEVICIDAAGGDILWRQKLVVAGARPEAPEVMEEEDGFAAPTGVVDGRRVYALFANGLAGCFDFQGRQLWSRSFAPLENHYGHASSLAMEEKLVFLQLDQATRDDGKSRVVAIDALTGTTVWEARREVDASWASPIVAPAPSGPQLILSATPWAIAYEPASGAEIWRAKCLEGEVAPSPIYSAGKVYVAHSDAVLSAIKPDGKGDVTETHIAWTAEDNLPNTASPVSSGELLFLLETQGWVTCYDASDGSKQWEHEIESNFYSSPSLAGDRLLVIDQKGVSYLLHAGRELKELGSSKLGEGVISSPAFSAGRIFIRGQKHLFAIGNTEAGERQER